MRRRSFVLSGLCGLLTSLPLIAVSYLGQQLAGLPFIPFDLFDWLARVLPGPVVNFGIETMVRLITGLRLGPISDIAKQMEHAQGILLVVAGGALVGVVQAFLLRRTRWSGLAVGTLTGAASFLLFLPVEIRLGLMARQSALTGLVWLVVLLLGWQNGLGLWLGGEPARAGTKPDATVDRLGRRALLQLAGGALGLAVVAGALGELLAARRRLSVAGSSIAPASSSPAAPAVRQTPQTVGSGLLPAETPPATAEVAARDLFIPAPGTRSEVTPTDHFYRVDIDAGAPPINIDEWGVDVGGLFDRPRRLTLADLKAYPPVNQPITLSCISNPVGGDLIGTAYWTGASLPTVLKDLGLRPEAKALGVGSEDDYYESVELQDMLDPQTLLVYGMNGSPLSQGHGFPLRIYIPNRYGMKQPKWIISLVALPKDGPGYWVNRRWSAEAVPQTVSVIDAVAVDHIQDGRVPVGGIAWAGARGIEKVEVQVDGGAWEPALLRLPPLGPFTWVQWRYDWPAATGHHTFTVRATDGTGALQSAQDAGSFPNGASGYHSVEATVV
jgi:DMSO/TMAO reductase YedYZ molybdopterin-dependent catalytic subunit